VLENLRLRELIAIVKANKAFYDEFIQYLTNKGYHNISQFIAEDDDKHALDVITSYLRLPTKAKLYDGIGRPYVAAKAQWYFLAWLFRDAPVQRLEPLLKGLPGETPEQRKAYLLNEVRRFIKPLLPNAEHWTWPVISEVLLARLEGSRRALKGARFEDVIRQCLRELFEQHSIPLTVSPHGAKIGGETYDVVVKGKRNSILMPVKTRETMGGGHSLLFTRDIHKSIGTAKGLGYICIPIIIAEAWSGDLKALNADAFIYIKANPNQVNEVTVELQNNLESLVTIFQDMGMAI
jgi:hypothetical protein